MRTKRESSGAGQGGRWWLLILLAVLLAPVGLTAAKQAIFSLDQSPATGRAQVVTQGIAELPAGEVVWRVVERTARPRVDAVPGRRVLGFVMATDEPVLLTNVTPEGNKDVARLAPGESFLVEAGTRQIRASFTDESVTYLSFELVSADDARDTNGGTLLYVTDPFTAPAGKHDIDLVRNVLLDGDVATLPNTGQDVAILATEGAIDILPGGGRSQTLQAGESQIFEAGEIEISPATPAAAAGARALVAGMTSSLQTADENRAAYVIAVIGPEIPPPPTPEATETSAAPSQPTTTPEPQPTVEQLGSIGVTMWLCPPGMTIENLTGEACQPRRAPMDAVLSSDDGDRTVQDAVLLELGWVWTDLPLGDYYFAPTLLPEGAEGYFVPGSAAVGGSPETGYSVTIDESAPEIGLDLYIFTPATTGSIAVFLGICGYDQSPEEFDPGACPGWKTGVDMQLVSNERDQSYAMSEASFNDGWLTWSELPLGDYVVIVNSLPRGYSLIVGPGGLSEVGAGFRVSISESQPGISLALYAFPPYIG